MVTIPKNFDTSNIYRSPANTKPDIKEMVKKHNTITFRKCDMLPKPHIVVKGECLDKIIQKRYGLTNEADIAAARKKITDHNKRGNPNFNEDIIKPGQKIYLPVIMINGEIIKPNDGN